MSGYAHDFDELEVYQLSMGLACWIYELTAKLPESERYNLVSQLRRAATSVSANIAEGFGRYHYKENMQYCRMARGSLSETKSHMMLCVRLKFIEQSAYNEFITKYRNLSVKLNNYIKAIGTHVKKQGMTIGNHRLTIASQS
jgi:four helix bundle protein